PFNLVISLRASYVLARGCSFRLMTRPEPFFKRNPTRDIPATTFESGSDVRRFAGREWRARSQNSSPSHRVRAFGLTAALTVWNVGIAFVVGVAAHWLLTRKVLHL